MGRNMDFDTENVDRFLQRASASDEFPFGVRSIQRTISPIDQTMMHIEGQALLYIVEKTLGQGAFSIWNRI